MHQPQEILDFWTGLGPRGWYAVDAAVDDAIRHRFGDLWEEAREGGFADWRAAPEGALAYLILTDQFPRNMFRGEARAFATDARALDCARHAVAQRFDDHVEGPIRQFFWLPFMHSEDPADQARSVAIFEARMPGDSALHARAHAEVIRRFGRFPYRNAALGRASTPEEERFLAEGGYRTVVAALSGGDDPGG